MIRKGVSLLVVFCALGAFQAARAQLTTASLSGTIFDESGAILPGATIRIKHVETGSARTMVSDDQGRYKAVALEPGSYEASAELSGFQTSVRSGIKLAVGQEAVINFSLKVGEITERIVVVAQAPLVETASSAVAHLVDDKKIRDLPLNGRSFEQLATLQPGVVSIPTAGRSISQGQGRKISIAGSRPTQVSFLLDGTDINDTFNNTPGSAAGNLLGVETVREFQTLTSSFSAEFGRSAGGAINSITRSGTNELHGTLFEFHRNSALDARNFFDIDPDNPTARSDPPAFKRNQFGFTVGGPIKKDKTFFFSSYEGLRERLGLSEVARVPTAEARQGRLPGRAPIAVAPAIKPVLALYPLPNGPELSGGVGLFFSSPTRPTDEDFFVVKIDHNFTDRDSFFARYSFDDARFVTPDELQAFQEHGESRAQYFTIEEKKIFSPRLLNIFRFAYNRSVVAQFDTPIAADVPFLVPNQPAIGVAFGPINVTGLTTLGTGGTNPKHFFHNLFEFTDNVSFTSGGHSFKFGFNAKRIQLNFISEFTTGAQYRFTSLANFLQARAQRLEIQLPGVDTQRGLRQSLFGFFIQDDYKVTRKLTLNLGLRYEFITVPTEVNGKVANLRDPLRDAQTTVGDPFFENPSLLNFAPRVGLAWDPTGSGKTAIRAGFGIFHDQILPFAYRNPMSRVPPFWEQGFLSNPPFPPDFSAAFGARRRIDIFSFRPEQPNRIQYSLTIQREILPETVIQVGYVGARGLHLIRPQEDDTAVPFTDAQGRHFFSVDAQGRSLHQRRNPNFGNIRNRHTDTNAFYNSLQLQVNRRFSRGFQFQAAYTLSKSIDEAASSVGGTDFVTEQGTLQDADCRRCDRGLSPFDVRHAFVLNFTYDLPFGSDLGGAVRAIIGGWQVNGILTTASGNPFNVVLGFDRAGQLTRSGGDAQRPNLKPGASNNPRLGSPDLWFDPSVFDLAPPGYFGNLGRNTISAPGLATFDFALIKSFRISEERSVQFRAEFFNLFNRANFAVPADLEIFSGVSRVGGRELPVLNPAVGRIEETTTTSRQVQFGLKLVF